MQTTALAPDGLSAPQIAERRYTAVQAEICRRDLRKFVRRVWPLIDPAPLKAEWHLDAVAEHLAFVSLGDIKNLMILLPPRSTKSLIVSVCFPAWVWTNEPEQQFLCASYASDLANIHALLMRRLIETQWYMTRYTGVVILSDENRVDRFSNTAGGYRTSISVGSKTTGLGGNYLILDDANNAADVEHEAARKNATEWHDNAWRSRVNDPITARRVYVGQRTHDGDVLGHVLAREEKRWTTLMLPLEYDGARKCITYRNKGEGPYGEPIFRDPRELPNSILCPERYDEKTIEALKESTPERTWNAQYQQQPEGAGGIILKRKWWRRWGWPEWHPEYRKTERPLPEVFEVIQSYDTAFEPDEQSDFSVRTTWGLFYHEEDHKPGSRSPKAEPRFSAILLERKKWKPTFGELRDDAIDSYNIWEPDRILVEKKASGHCYSDDTEILTKRGWLRFSEINIAADLFATRNPKTKAFEWQRATAEIHERYNGEMIHFHGRPVDALVTPNHRMLVYTETPGRIGNGVKSGEAMVEARHLLGPKGGRTWFPMTSRWQGAELGKQSFPISESGRAARFTDKPNLKWLSPAQELIRKRNCAKATERTIHMSGDDYCAFMAAFLSEGWTRIAKNNKGCTLHISQRKKGTEAYRRFEGLLSRIQGKPVRHDGTDFIVHRRGLVEHVRQFGARAWDKFIPDAIMNAPPRQLRIFWDYYMLGDGSVASGSQTITTTSKVMAGQLVEIAQKIGFSASVRVRPGAYRDRVICGNKRPTLAKNCKLIYIVQLRVSQGMGFHTKAVPYDGIVHCVQVPNGVVYTRRNGKPLWCGNSLIQELRKKGLPVRGVPVRGDLVYRAHMASLPLEKRAIWYIERAWAKDVIEENAKFPSVVHDDQVSSCVLAWQYMRKHMDLQLDDEDGNTEDLNLFDPKLYRRASIYG